VVSSGVSPDETTVRSEREARSLNVQALTPDHREAQIRAGVRRPDDEVVTDARWAADQRSGDWVIRWVLAPGGAGRIVRSLHIEPETRGTPAGGITADMLRSLSPSAAAAAEWAPDADPWHSIWERYVGEKAHTPPFPTGARGRGRPGLSGDHLARVAIAYLREQGRGRGLLRRLGEEFDLRPETMRDQVRSARQSGYLSNDAHPGRRGAEPGPELLRWLDERGEKL